MNTILGSFLPEFLTKLELEQLFNNYRRTYYAIQRKIDALQDGKHTIMSENGISLLKEMKDVLSQRIDAILARQAELKKRRH